MIDVQSEPLISLAQAAKLVPARGGRTRCATTLWRWITKGHQGVCLEGVQTPDNVWWTSAAAVTRFLARITQQSLAAAPTQLSEEIAAANERATRRLNELWPKKTGS